MCFYYFSSTTKCNKINKKLITLTKETSGCTKELE